MYCSFASIGHADIMWSIVSSNFFCKVCTCYLSPCSIFLSLNTLFLTLGLGIIIMMMMNMRASRLKTNDNTKDKGLSFPHQNTKDSFIRVKRKTQKNSYEAT